MRVCIIICFLYLLSCVPVTITLPDGPDTISLWVDGRPCIDESKKNTGGGCPMIYTPTCGCDGYVYENPCIAARNGVLFYLDKEVCSE